MCHILCDDKSMNMDGKLILSPMKYAIPIPIRTIPIPISIPISSPKLLPFPWESHGNVMHTSSLNYGSMKSNGNPFQGG